MDFAVDMPKSYLGNVVLCVWVCWFTGYVICKALSDRKAHTVACAFEECVFHRFGAPKFATIVTQPLCPQYFANSISYSVCVKYPLLPIGLRPMALQNE